MIDSLIAGLSAVIVVLRTGLTVVLAAAAVLAGIAWAVRTRRVRPFGGVARFARSSLDPLIAPIERRVVRAGGSGASAPWWTLFFIFVVGVGILLVLSFLHDTLVRVSDATRRGPRGLAALAITGTFGLLQLALLVRVITSWVGGSYSWAGRLATRLTDWCVGPILRVLPPFGGIDASPLIAWLLLGLLEGAILRVL